jgi:hypothetical protein
MAVVSANRLELLQIADAVAREKVIDVETGSVPSWSSSSWSSSSCSSSSWAGAEPRRRDSRI